MEQAEQKLCILAIDDTPMYLAELGRILAARYSMKMAKKGSEGIRLAAEYQVDLILLDLLMPEMSGFDVLEQLKSSEKTKHIPVIIVTGSTSEEDKVKGLALGAIDFVRKPFADENVMLVVESILRYHSD